MFQTGRVEPITDTARERNGKIPAAKGWIWPIVGPGGAGRGRSDPKLLRDAPRDDNCPKFYVME